MCFITTIRAAIAAKFNSIIPMQKSNTPNVVLNCPNSKLAESVSNLAQALFTEKLNEVQDGISTSIDGEVKQNNYQVELYVFNTVPVQPITICGKFWKYDQTLLNYKNRTITIDLTNKKTISKFFNSAFNYLVALIGVVRGRWFQKGEEKRSLLSEILNLTAENYKRFFHLQRRADKYCWETIQAIKKIESQYHINIHIHGQHALDLNCESEYEMDFSIKFDDFLDDKNMYLETIKHYTFYYNKKYENYIHEKIHNQKIYPKLSIKENPYFPFSSLRYYDYEYTYYYKENKYIKQIYKYPEEDPYEEFYDRYEEELEDYYDKINYLNELDPYYYFNIQSVKGISYKELQQLQDVY